MCKLLTKDREFWSAAAALRATAERWRFALGYVGEDGIETGVAYCVRDGKLARKDGAS